MTRLNDPEVVRAQYVDERIETSPVPEDVPLPFVVSSRGVVFVAT